MQEERKKGVVCAHTILFPYELFKKVHWERKISVEGCKMRPAMYKTIFTSLQGKADPIQGSAKSAVHGISSGLQGPEAMKCVFFRTTEREYL